MTALEARGKMVQAGPVRNEKAALRRYFRQFGGQAVAVAVEACGFWPAFREVVEPEVERLVLVHPQRVKAIASAKLKNDRVDSATLAHLLRCDLLPESWKADRQTQGRRQQVRLRATLVRQRTRLKNQVHAVLHQQGLHSPVTDLFGRRGRQWLTQVQLPAAARETVNACLRGAIMNGGCAKSTSTWRTWRWRASCCARSTPCCTTACCSTKKSLRRGKGNPPARSHPCSSRTTLRGSGGVRRYLMCCEHE
jgi:hypothetical protein